MRTDNREDAFQLIQVGMRREKPGDAISTQNDWLRHGRGTQTKCEHTVQNSYAHIMLHQIHASTGHTHTQYDMIKHADLQLKPQIRTHQ